MIPAVVYREGNSQPLKIPHKELLAFMKKIAGELAMVNLTFPGGENKLALLKLAASANAQNHSALSSSTRARVSLRSEPVSQESSVFHRGGSQDNSSLFAWNRAIRRLPPRYSLTSKVSTAMFRRKSRPGALESRTRKR